MDTMTLKAGTVVHVQGTPVELASDTEVRTAEGNVGLIESDLSAPKTFTGTDTGTANLAATAR